MCVVFESVREGRFTNVRVKGGGGGHIFLAQSCKLDNAQDGAMRKGPLTIPNPNRRRCCPCPHGLGPHYALCIVLLSC